MCGGACCVSEGCVECVVGRVVCLRAVWSVWWACCVSEGCVGEREIYCVVPHSHALWTFVCLLSLAGYHQTDIC